MEDEDIVEILIEILKNTRAIKDNSGAIAFSAE